MKKVNEMKNDDKLMKKVKEKKNDKDNTDEETKRNDKSHEQVNATMHWKKKKRNYIRKEQKVKNNGWYSKTN